MSGCLYLKTSRKGQSPNLPLWCKDYSELKATENQMMHEKFSVLLFLPTEGHIFPFVQVASTLAPLRGGQQLLKNHCSLRFSTERSV